MAKPLIGITCSSSVNDPHATNPQDRANSAYSRAVALAGGIPFLIPNIDEPEIRAEYLKRIDGLLLSGGYDIGPELFGESKLNETVDIDSTRDRAEIPLIRDALGTGVSILAICRGIQSLNVALGGSLYQDIPSQVQSEVLHRQTDGRSVTTHSVQTNADSLTHDIVRSHSFMVNSFHHQAIKDVGEKLVVTAYAEDGIIEAMELPGDRFVVGVQWHPEELVDVSEEARRLFSALVRVSSDGR